MNTWLALLLLFPLVPASAYAQLDPCQVVALEKEASLRGHLKELGHYFNGMPLKSNPFPKTRQAWFQALFAVTRSVVFKGVQLAQRDGTCRSALTPGPRSLREQLETLADQPPDCATEMAKAYQSTQRRVNDALAAADESTSRESLEGVLDEVKRFRTENPGAFRCRLSESDLADSETYDALIGVLQGAVDHLGR